MLEEGSAEEESEMPRMVIRNLEILARYPSAFVLRHEKSLNNFILIFVPSPAEQIRHVGWGVENA